MCGIFLYCGEMCDVNTLHALFMKTKHRGPDDTQFVVFRTADTMVVMGFHRLTINGVRADARQPFLEKGCVAMCNGEIWNHRELETDIGTALHSGSDCEVLPHLYRHVQQNVPRYHHQHPFEEMLRDIDGVFGMALYDRHSQHIHLARDRIGIRSLYYATTPRASATTTTSTHPSAQTHNLWVASELKSLPTTCAHVQPFPPGCWMSWPVAKHACEEQVGSECTTPQSYWTVEETRHATTESVQPGPFDSSPKQRVCEEHHTSIQQQLEQSLVNAVQKRLMSDRPVGCVLSGGLDSTIVTAIACKLSAQQSVRTTRPKIRTYTIGLKGAEDLKWARKAAEVLGTEHHEFVVSEAEFLEAIPEVIRQIESYDVTTVRASVGNWLLAKHIKAEGKDTVLLCGDVADELFGGYRGFGLCKDPQAFDAANVRMLKDIHRFDVLRCEKSFAGHGLEARVPFADMDFVKLAMSLPPEYKMWGAGADGGEDTRIEKHLLRKAFEHYLPSDLAWRRKEAFSDGVSTSERSWFSIIQESVQSVQSVHTQQTTHTAPQHDHASTSGPWPYDTESQVYRTEFEKHYCNPEVIPYYWKHPFTNVRDPSARCLSNYHHHTSEDSAEPVS